MAVERFSFEKNRTLFDFLNDIFRQTERVGLQGSMGSYDAMLISALFTGTGRPVAVFTADNRRAETLARECASLAGEESTVLFPSRDGVPYNMRSPFGPTVEKRFGALSHLMNGKKAIYITTPAAALQKIPPPKDLFNHIIKLHQNDALPQETLAAWLIDNGFTRETLVEDIGTFAIRGGIVDIYPFLSENPVRLEFWGDTIDSIREFDVFRQNTVKMLSSAEIFPMKEFCLTDAQIDRGLVRIEEHCRQNAIDPVRLQKLHHLWKQQSDYDGIEWFLHWFDPSFVSFLDYLPGDAILVWDDLLDPQRRLEECRENYAHHLNRVPEIFMPFVSKPEELLIPAETVREKLSSFGALFINTQQTEEGIPVKRLTLQEQPSFGGNLNLIVADLKQKCAEGYLTTILCENSANAERLVEHIGTDCPDVTIAIGNLETGFVDPVHQTALYSESQMFNRGHYVAQGKKTKKSAPITSYDTLLPGDFVVHIDHGIAKFCGVKRIQTTGTHQDCMELLYQDNVKVYVPIEDFHKVRKYIGKDASAPLLSKLGTARWEKQKAKARESLREMADKLVGLYARRHYLEGIQFSADSVWQKEFEESFMFEPTPDQLTAIEQVKKDMMSSKPMDRLVCGDVGFGKTEIAMRAAFKAAMDGYQVALLAPTTILAAQHLATFSQRMANYPLRVAGLSRFQNSKEQREIVKNIQTGAIHIVIGTHRILSKDIAFHNLGLLIIDEEQRFGVIHKEKLKQYRFSVDVLSMTATPIPRTLHLSLIGIRDLSIINTPPKNRLPIETHVLEQHDEIVHGAIENELERGGQVYVVDNRIKNLPHLQDIIERAVPRARVALAHGQMEETRLETIMKEFVAGKHDVLLSTAIIESGLDIPNVNTLIVNHAEHLGLSQLYQLRGRVGRSAEQAYAYFLVKSLKHISETSLKRLRALQQYTDLGSGFQIAMRDLEIRGAGNILGAEQHGVIASIGFELYCSLLKEEIGRIRGDAPEETERSITLDLGVDAYIPADYIADGTTRVLLYQQCSACKHIGDITAIEKEFVDRFGPAPQPLQALLMSMKIRILARQAAISHIKVAAGNSLQISFHHTEEKLGEILKKAIAYSNRQFEVSYDTPVILKTVLISRSPLLILAEINHIIENL